MKIFMEYNFLLTVRLFAYHLASSCTRRLQPKLPEFECRSEGDKSKSLESQTIFPGSTVISTLWDFTILLEVCVVIVISILGPLAPSSSPPDVSVPKVCPTSTVPVNVDFVELVPLQLSTGWPTITLNEEEDESPCHMKVGSIIDNYSSAQIHVPKQ